MYRISLLLISLFLASACSSLSYYRQAVSGHLSLLAKSESIGDILEDPATSVELRKRLGLVKELIKFAQQELSLPNHGSYEHYVKVSGRYVVWNVIATPEFSVQARQWCYPVAGCVTYRGYYAEQDAEAFALELSAEGLDTTIAGASAYSTLGWMDDPLFSSMLYKDELRLAEVIFHELAHQRLYVSGDTVFNESFASVVAREGVRRWLIQREQPEKYQRFLQEQEMDRQFTHLLMHTREELQGLYSSTASASIQDKRVAKAAIFMHLQDEYRRLKETGAMDGRYDQWMSRPMNNARLALVATYHQLEPKLEQLLSASDLDMEQFYLRAADLQVLGVAQSTVMITD